MFGILPRPAVRAWTRGRFAALVVVAAAAAFPGCGGRDEPAAVKASDAAIEPRRGIAGVRLAMTTAAVEQALGSPHSERESELHAGWTKWRYRRPRLRVTFDERGTVWDVRTYAREHRTREGVGVGSTEDELLRALPRLRCRPYGGPPRYRDWRSCKDGPALSEPLTTYTLVDGRVDFVTVARGVAV